MNLLDAIITFFERLGVCVAVFAVSGAIIFYRNQILSIWPMGAGIIGLFLFFVSFFLCVYVAADSYATMSKITSKKSVQILLAAFLVIISIIFLLAGGIAAFSALKA